MSDITTMLQDGTITDPFFQVIHDSEWNACIGAQGEELNYVEGYLIAAELLADALVERKLYGSRDTLAMPILQNARHGIELALKYVLHKLAAIEMAREREGAANHDVTAYWEHLAAQNVGDLRCRTLIASLEPFARSLGSIDPDGQELRYFENRDGVQSLADHAVVHMLLVQASIKELREILDQLLHRIFDLAVEIAAGAHTPECSRADLIAIAGIVGSRESWKDDAFLASKAEAMERFGLTSNGFSRALAAIGGARQLKTLIGVETPLTYLSADAVTEVAARWLETNPPQQEASETDVISTGHIKFENIMRGLEADVALDRWALGRLSIEEFADLQTVFYIGRNREFGELYERSLENTLATHRLETNRTALVHHIMSKSNFIDGIIVGLKRVGQPQLAATVVRLRDDARPKE